MGSARKVYYPMKVKSVLALAILVTPLAQPINAIYVDTPLVYYVLMIVKAMNVRVTVIDVGDPIRSDIIIWIEAMIVFLPTVTVVTF